MIIKLFSLYLETKPVTPFSFRKRSSFFSFGMGERTRRTSPLLTGRDLEEGNDEEEDDGDDEEEG
jgi:hypothetical protein